MRTIRGRIVLAIVLVGGVPLLVGLILAYMSGMRSLRDVIGGNFRTIAAQAADRVTLLIQGEVQAVKLLASAPLRVRQPVIDANRTYQRDDRKPTEVIQERIRAWENGTAMSDRLLKSELSRFLTETKVRDGDRVAGLLITDRYGALVAASSEPARYFFGDEVWWRRLQEAGAGQVFISEVISGQSGSFGTPEETIDIAVPILDDHQRTMIGAIKASYRFDALFGMVNQIRIGQTGHAMLFNAAGEPLVCPVLPRKAHRIPEPLMALIVSDEPGWTIAADDGHGARETVVGFAPVRGLGAPLDGWHIFVRQHPSESYAPIREQVGNLALIGMVMVALLGGMGQYVAARIARPIQVLKDGVEAISRGTYDGPLGIRTGDEFEDLSIAIHRMADNLKESRGELEALNRDLAVRIDEKTAEVARQMRRVEISERLAALGKVASGIAHEINNPLGIILNRIECMEVEAVQLPLSDELRRDLTAIRAQAERILRVTRSMLTFSRGAASTLKPIDLNCVVRACLAMAGERLSARHVRLQAHLHTDVLPVMGDRARLETVVINVINNAIDAVQERGEQAVVEVASSVMPSTDGEWATVTVSDNGPGIPEDALERIFDPFFTTKTAAQGNGLGLFLSYGIVSEHRGRLDVANGERGAIFTVRLPALRHSPLEEFQEQTWESRTRS
ncbi:MAG: HAMP domain-containing protein [Nitrospiraceae bacterium]|nr:HAMP domain-containing protein [Nitrospiraceae bacterium]